ncbi:unnamed protein product [Rotaria magnacalcarata]|uniref:Uncharacterized protein n=1 Tax=Rotaria magnacalcarata TaxID=392030 RepID=A0A816QNX4_9BILA|nr:unnamed protein product [Rotaria magnacalcarata]
MTIDVQQPFNILFTQIPDGDYYLTVLRERFSPSEYIQTQVSPKHRCHPVLDLFNETFRLYKYPRLVKYYSLLCRQDSQLICFYDENCMCMCDNNCVSNCFQHFYPSAFVLILFSIFFLSSLSHPFLEST